MSRGCDKGSDKGGRLWLGVLLADFMARDGLSLNLSLSLSLSLKAGVLLADFMASDGHDLLLNPVDGGALALPLCRILALKAMRAEELLSKQDLVTRDGEEEEV